MSKYLTRIHISVQDHTVLSVHLVVLVSRLNKSLVLDIRKLTHWSSTGDIQ